MFTIRKNDLVRAGTDEFYALIQSAEEFNRKGQLQVKAANVEKEAGVKAQRDIQLDRQIAEANRQLGGFKEYSVAGADAAI